MVPNLLTLRHGITELKRATHYAPPAWFPNHFGAASDQRRDYLVTVIGFGKLPVRNINEWTPIDSW